jgi:hypothetical protein
VGVLNSTKRSRLAKGTSGLLTLSTILESQLRVVVVAERTVSGLLLLWLLLLAGGADARHWLLLLLLPWLAGCACSGRTRGGGGRGWVAKCTNPACRWPRCTAAKYRGLLGRLGLTEYVGGRLLLNSTECSVVVAKRTVSGASTIYTGLLLL